MNNEERVIKLYKEVLGCYASYITSKTDSSKKTLFQTLDRVDDLLHKLHDEDDKDSIVLLSMWYIDGEGWRNLEPEDDQISVAVSACNRALANRGKVMEFMNLDLQYMNPSMTTIETEDDVDNLVNEIKEAHDTIQQEAEKIEKEDTMEDTTKTNKRTEEETVNDEKQEEVKEETKTSNKKKYTKYALTGLVALTAVAAAGVYLYKKFSDDGVIVIDFGK